MIFFLKTGHSFDDFGEDPPSEFSTAVKNLMLGSVLIAYGVATQPWTIPQANLIRLVVDFSVLAPRDKIRLPQFPWIPGQILSFF